MQIDGAVVVVTGASSGIGRATALAFAERGARLVLTARREPALDEVARLCNEAGATALVAAADVSDPEQVEEVARRAVEAFGRIDVWVNDAAVSVYAPFVDTPLEDFRRVLEVNLLGCVYGSRAALTRMREQGGGVLVNVSSIVGEVPQPYASAYAVTKAGIKALSASLRQELMLEGGSSRRVHVVSVLPATIDTPFFRHAANYTGRAVKAMPPVYPPERVAAAIVGAVRVPRRQVMVGPMGRVLVLQSKAMPGLAERTMAIQVDRTHLSRSQPAAPTQGNLYQPQGDGGSIEGGWSGRCRTRMRRVMSAALLAGTVAGMRMRRS